MQTLGEIMAVLGPALKKAESWAELNQSKTGGGALFIRGFAQTGQLVNEWMIPYGVAHDIDLVMSDPQMDPAKKKAAVGLILGRALRDKAVQLVGGSRHGAEEEEPATQRPGATHIEEGTGTGEKPSETGAETKRPLDEEHTPLPTASGQAGKKAGSGNEEETPVRREEQPTEAKSLDEKPVSHTAAPQTSEGLKEPAVSKSLSGMPEETIQSLTEVADAWGVVIDVRPPGQATRSRLAEGAVPKPEEIKAKTINGLDVLLGARPDAIGLVGYFDPKRPTRTKEMSQTEWEAVVDRFVQRKDEFHDLDSKMTELTANGTVRVRDGVVRIQDPRGDPKGPKRYRPVAGDVDLYQIHRKSDGQPMTDSEADAFAAYLRSQNIAIEHYAHVNWHPKNATEREVHKNIIGRHGPGGEPLIRFEPGTAPRHVNNETPVEPSGGAGPVVKVSEKSAAGPSGGTAGTGGGSESETKPQGEGSGTEKAPSEQTGPTAKPVVTSVDDDDAAASPASGQSSAKGVPTAAEVRTAPILHLSHRSHGGRVDPLDPTFPGSLSRPPSGQASNGTSGHRHATRPPADRMREQVTQRS